jgi:hypothetical protein
MTERRLAGLQPGIRTVLMSHFPLIREPAESLRYPEFVQRCDVTRTADWHVRFNAVAVVQGQSAYPTPNLARRVRFEEVSLGYPDEWRQNGAISGMTRRGPLTLGPVLGGRLTHAMAAPIGRRRENEHPDR